MGSPSIPQESLLAPHPLITTIAHTCTQHQLINPGDTVLAAVSGGIDSLVMLHALCELRTSLNFQLHVATLDHGLRGEASRQDAAFVAATAAEWGIPCTSGTADVPTLMAEYGLNLEEAARQARYGFLMNVAHTINAQRIAIAHNRDDQAETVLMNILRGTGLRGLRGMLYAANFYEIEDWIEDDSIDPADFLVIRPLLNAPRQMIEAYADEHGLIPHEDETNTDTQRLRNAVRHNVLPLLQALNPNINAALTRLATIVQGDVEVIDNRVEQVGAWMIDWTETEGDDFPGEVAFLDREAYQEQPVGIQRALLRKVVYELAPGVRDLSFDIVERARMLILTGKTGAQLELPDEITLRVGYDEVTIGYGGNPAYPQHLPGLSPHVHIEVDPDAEQQPVLAGQLRLVTYWVAAQRLKDWRPESPLECALAVPPNATLTLRTWQEGDRFRPFGMAGQSQKLSDTFTNLKVPAFYRDRVPLLLVNDEIAWFVAPTVNGPQSRISEKFAIRDDNHTSVLRLRWQVTDTA